MPKTFGIRFGCVVLCLVLTGRIMVLLVILAIPSDPWVIFGVGLASSLAAILICVFFKEKLDVRSLIRHRVIVFQDFGIRVGS